jgi:hypothetical protein
MRNDPVPDPCPDILDKLENLREQRVNQTAHLIVAEALGLRLRSPQISAKTRSQTDTHGEYEVVRQPADMIVLEDLARYLSDQGRAKSENTRLMKWCHRAITQKVKMLAESFGIPVLETPAAYSSRFCSLTGVAGFRAAEVNWDSRDEFRWRVLLDEVTNAREQDKVPSELALKATELFSQLKAIAASDRPHRTLLAPQAGGPIFVTVREVPHPAPTNNGKLRQSTEVSPMQADINAAINLALRAIAHPSRPEVHHRLRTERKKEGRNKTDSFSARETRRFGKTKVAIVMREGDSMPKDRNPNLFFDGHCLAEFGRARLATDPEKSFVYASGPGLWKKVNDRAVQWERCAQINATRLSQWETEEDDVPM